MKYIENEIFQNRLIEPMLIGKSTTPFDDKDYYFEIKFDGARTLIYGNKDGVHLINKRKIDISKGFEELNCTFDHEVILDSEIVIIDENGPNFSLLTSRLLSKDRLKAKLSPYKADLMIFDILYIDGKSLLDTPLCERKRILEKIIFKNDRYHMVKYIKEHGKALYDIAYSQGLEGIVAKQINSLYFSGKRTKVWMKIKNLLDSDFLILYYRATENGSVIGLGKNYKGGYYYCGETTYYGSLKLFKRIDKYNIINLNKTGDFIYVEPSNVCNVAFMAWTKNKHLRQPIFKGIRNDVNKEDVIFDN